ncbi:MAG TPA: tRNA (cytidine(34)-2'-O)-methyltransferase [Longimicrobium sp.]|jgi:tRNA (cytidine/uridine-2'-O-)-methyltransferase|uniref:tRNA (cytidine(34)-2'-O)-methyltransferase n=1 Tax=Longimicrobium sp. TaxID=2029185 RepID=UPI002ED7D6BB
MSTQLPLSPPIHVALLEPEIPGNAGAVARLCGATGSPLHLIGRLGFSFTHPKAKRAMMDYWQHTQWHHHLEWEDFTAATAGRRVWMLTTKATRTLWGASFQPGDVLLFGPESRGLPEHLLAADPERCIRIPMLPVARSLNLSTAVGISLFEALRQVGWIPAGAVETGETPGT